MGISKQSDYWTARLAGPTYPNSPVGSTNKTWTQIGGNDVNDELGPNSYRVLGDSGPTETGIYWGIGEQTANDTVTFGSDGWTLVVAFSTTTNEANDTLIDFELGNGTKGIVKIDPSTGTITIVDATDAVDPTFTSVDLKMQDDYAVPTILRLTLTNDKVRIYLNEMIEDDDGNTMYKEITCGGSGLLGYPYVRFGSAKNDVDFYAVYFTEDGAYSPDEMDLSDFTSHSLMRTGMKVVEVLRNSRRLYLNNFVQDAGIFYGYDLSSNAMVNRSPAPTVHVMVQKADSPDFLTLAGARTDQRYDVNVFVTTRGTNYENAYRLGASILGEVFDELYTQTGLESGVDSLISYNAVFDTKVDDDETVCIHSLTLTYMKKVRMFLREV